MTPRFQDNELLDAVSGLALNHGHPAMERFKIPIRDRGDRWIAVEPAYHPATELLIPALDFPGCDERRLRVYRNPWQSWTVRQRTLPRRHLPVGTCHLKLRLNPRKKR